MISLFLTLAFILGLILTKGELYLTIPLSVIYLLFLLYRIGAKKTLISFSLFCIGIAISNIPIQNNPHDNTYSGVVIDVKDNYYVFASGFEKFYIRDPECNKECGDILSLNGNAKEINFTTYESKFNFNEYLANKGINRSIEVKKEEVKFNNPLRINKRRKAFLSKFNSETASLIDSFLFNHKDYETSTIQLASSINILSILSMNGMYLYLIISLLEYLLKRYFSKNTSSLIATLFLLPYAMFSFTKFGVIRVLSMRLISYINKRIFKSRFIYIELLSFQMLFFLLIDYHLIYQQTFYLGFIISFMLIFIRRYSKKVNERLVPIIIVLTLSILMFPLSIQSDYNWHLFSPLFQILLMPIHQLYVLCSIFSFYTFQFGFVLNNFTRLILTFYRILSYVDIKVPIGEISLLFRVLYFINFGFLFFLYESKRWKHFKICIITMVSIILISVTPIRTYFRNAVYFLNVGQGDSIIIQNKSYAIMIDTGGNKSFDMAEETLIPFLRRKNIYKLDALITSHDDFDHSGAKDSLMQNFKVERYLNLPEQFPFNVGDITLTNLNTMDAKDENDQSLVLTMDFMKKKWMFLGDASIAVEKFLIDKNIDLDCDILKVGHHGSKTSTSNEFLQATTPDIAIISVGAENYYGHPSKEVIDNLTNNHIKIRRTDIEGTISFVEFAYKL